MLSHEFSDMPSRPMYALDCTKIMSFSVIRNAVSDKFAGVYCGDMWRRACHIMLVLTILYCEFTTVCRLSLSVSFFTSLYCLPLWRIKLQ